MPTEPDGIGKWSPNSIEPKCQQPCVGGAESSLDEILEHELLCWLNEDKPIGEEVATLRPYLYGELNHLFGIAANETDNRCVEDILTEAERLMQATHLPTDRDQQLQLSPMVWNELLQSVEITPSLAADNERNRKLNRHQHHHNPQKEDVMQIAQVLDLDCPVSDNGTAERQSCPRLPDQASPTSVPSEELAQDACHQQNGVSICASATIKNTFTQTASPCQRRHSNVTDLSTAVRNTCTTLSLYDQCVRSRPKQDASTSTVDRQMCDRSTQPSPTADEAFAADSWRKERLLGAKIVEMQDRLKDTEERYKSAKMQLDTLSVAYRTMHESHSALQQDNDKLQFDVRSITKCADFLRAQLHGAQCDRDAANELQKLLQSELEVSRAEKRKVQDSTEKDRRTIQDLQRQCREMERILMRKTPDTVSTLIVGCKTKEEQDGPSPSSNRQELVQRIAQLKADATARGLDDVQARFNAVQAKYETHIADLEMQVLSLQEINTKLSEKIIRQTEELGSVVPVPVAPPTTTCYTQTDLEGEAFRVQPPANAPVRSISVQTDETGPSEPVATGTTRQPPPTKKRTAQTTGASTATAAPVAPGKEDAHLLATIRGMRAELASKEKSVQRLTRELDECKKTIRKLQKKKEMPAVGQVAGAMAVPGKGDTGRSPAKLRNRDDPEHMGAMLREAESKVKVLEHDYTALQEKQLQDLKTLEACHVQERETFRESIRCLQQRLAESEEKLLQRSNLGNDYYRLKTKRKRSLLKRIVVPQGRLIFARKCWLTATGARPSVCKGLVQALLRNDLNHYTKAKSRWLRQVVAGGSSAGSFVQHPDCSTH